MKVLGCVEGEVNVTARILRGEDEMNSEFAVDERKDTATAPDVVEVCVVVRLMLTRFPDVVAALLPPGLFKANLNAGVVVPPPVRELDLVPIWWVVVKSAPNPVCPTSTSILSIAGDFVFSWWLIAEGSVVEGPVSLL